MLGTQVLATVFLEAAFGVAPDVVLQGPDELDGTLYSPSLLAVQGFLSTLILGGLYAADDSEYLDRIETIVHEDPIEVFALGMMVMLAFLAVILAVIFVFSIWILDFLGIIIVIGLLIVWWFLVLAAGALGYVALAATFLDGRAKQVVAGATIAGILGLIPVVGPIATITITFVGIGGIYRHSKESDREDIGGRTKQHGPL